MPLSPQPDLLTHPSAAVLALRTAVEQFYNPHHDRQGRFAPKQGRSAPITDRSDGGPVGVGGRQAPLENTTAGSTASTEERRAASKAMVDNIDNVAYVHGADNNDPEITKMRDRYVIADTPTLKMNAAMRGETKHTAGTKARQEEAMVLTRGTAKRDMVVHRAIVADEPFAASLQPGGFLESRGFQSTDEHRGMAELYGKIRQGDTGAPKVVEMRVRVPAGSHVGSVGAGEFVLRPGRARIISRSDDGDRVRLEVEHVES